MTTLQGQPQPDPSPRLSPHYVVGIGSPHGDGRIRAHAVLGLFDEHRHFGAAVCGTPVDGLTISETAWDDVPVDSRCPHCVAES